MSQTHTVLSGDIVASSRAGAARTDAAMEALSAAAATLAAALDEKPRFTRSRGDGWQILLSHPGQCLRATLMLSAALRAADIGLQTRIAAGIGAVERLGAEGLSAASGSAFEQSGHALDDMDRTRRLVIAGHGVTAWHHALFEVADWMVRRWSREQGEAVALLLAGDGTATMATLAASLDVSRQAFEARLAASGIRALDTALAAFEADPFAPGPQPATAGARP